MGSSAINLSGSPRRYLMSVNEPDAMWDSLDSGLVRAARYMNWSWRLIGVKSMPGPLSSNLPRVSSDRIRGDYLEWSLTLASLQAH